MLTNLILSEGLNSPISKVRRWTKELLPPDERATRRSGYTREFSINEGFYIYLGGTMVGKFGWTFAEAREALKIIWPWMESIGMMPVIPADAKRRGIDSEITQYNVINFYSDRLLSRGASNKIIAVEVSGYGATKVANEIDKYGKAYKCSQVDEISYFIFGEQPTISTQKNIHEVFPEYSLTLFLITTYINGIKEWFEPEFEGTMLSYFGWKAMFNELAEK